MRNIVLSILLLAGTAAAAQEAPARKTTKIKSTHIQTIVLDDGSGATETREEDKSLETFYYDKNGNMILNAKFNITANGLISRGTDIIYTYNDINQLLTDSTDRVKQFYSYDEEGRLANKNTVSYKNSPALRSDSVVYVYDAEVMLTVAEHYSSSNAKKTEERYTYGSNGKVEKMETWSFNSSGVSKNTYRADYVYNGDLLIEESVVKISGSTETPQNKVRYTYDTQGRVETDSTYKGVRNASGVYVFQLDTKKIFTYDGNESNPSRIDVYTYDTATETFSLTDYLTYTNGLYGRERTPQNMTVSAGDTETEVSFSLTKPSNEEGFAGYKIMADHAVIDTLFTTETFTLSHQTRGTHVYRVMAVYGDDMTANCSDAMSYNVVIDLPQPSNPAVVYMEYDTSWNVKFKWTTPVYENLTLKGYQWTVKGGNGIAKGSTDNPGQTSGTFTFYGNNIATVSLYAVYAEGEADPLVFEIDLTDPNQQITEHWYNKSFTRSNAEGNILTTGRYYYNSSYSGEKLAFQVNYDAEGNPSDRITIALRNYSTKPDFETREAYNGETMAWKDSIRINYGYTSSGTLNQKTTYLFDKIAGNFVRKQVEYYTFDYNVSYNDPAITTRYEFNAAGDSVITAYIKSSFATTGSTSYIQTDSIFGSDEESASPIGCVVVDYMSRGVAVSMTEYNCSENESTPVCRTMREYSDETALCVKETQQLYENGTWTTSVETLFTPSKEYHLTHAATNLKAKGDTLNWTEPTRISGLTGYKVLVNGVEYAVVDTHSYVINGLENGSYTFLIVPLYDGNDASLSNEITVSYINPYIFDNIAALRASMPVTDTEIIYTVKSEVLVMGSAGRDATYLFMEDENAGIQMRITNPNELNWAKGDKLTNLKGLLVRDEQGAMCLQLSSAKLVSTGSTVSPRLLTINEFNTDNVAFDACFVRMENVTLTEDNAAEGRAIATQNGENAILVFASDENAFYSGIAHVEGYASRRGDSYVIYVSAIDRLTDITPASDGNTPVFTTGNICFDNARNLEIYDTSGRKIASTDGNSIALENLPDGILLIKVNGLDGSSRTLKIRAAR